MNTGTQPWRVAELRRAGRSRLLLCAESTSASLRREVASTSPPPTDFLWVFWGPLHKSWVTLRGINHSCLHVAPNRQRHRPLNAVPDAYEQGTWSHPLSHSESQFCPSGRLNQNQEHRFPETVGGRNCVLRAPGQQCCCHPWAKLCHCWDWIFMFFKDLFITYTVLCLHARRGHH